MNRDLDLVARQCYHEIESHYFIEEKYYRSVFSHVISPMLSCCVGS